MASYTVPIPPLPIIRFKVHEPIFVPINGSFVTPGDGGGEIASSVVSSGEGALSLSLFTMLILPNHLLAQ